MHVSLRQKAIFIPANSISSIQKKGISTTTANFIANLARLGFGVTEDLMYALNQTNPAFQLKLLQKLEEVMGLNKNWTPLVKDWDIPTNESAIDHLMTFFANVFGAKGTTLQCGHIIPARTFPLERYNGCPFCGTPFEFEKLKNYGYGSNLKVLELWTEKDVQTFFEDLLDSKTPLDATQVDSLKILLKILPLPNEVKIGMKETLMLIIDAFLERNQPEKVQHLFTSPTDILRYLWYKHTGFLQIIEPKTIIDRKGKNSSHIVHSLESSAKAILEAYKQLALSYDRKTCVIVARWLTNLPLQAEQMCEMMHPKRGMWVRFIRALRLAEYSKKVGFEHLKKVLDVFYNQNYTVWQGRVDYYRLRADEENTLKLLQQRPSLFARSLFANMLWFGAENTLKYFTEVIDKVPARLVFTLNMYAENYFDKENKRAVKPLGGVNKTIPKNRLLGLYNQKQLETMKQDIENLSLLAVKKRFEKIKNDNKTIFIHKALFNIPISIGDRSETIQDMPAALMGTKFDVEGDKIRLFMQWGEGMKAQHLDMDLSCSIAYDKMTDYCSYSRLSPHGCKHSGDIISIPDKIGTAEYIDINIKELQSGGAKYVTFTCNAYSNGEITPNLLVGWMDSKFPMTISEKGVAYDPSCVQHQVRVTKGTTKGLVFGVLDVQNKKIIWLEMAFQGQVVQNLNTKGVDALLQKLNSKTSIGSLLTIKAEAQQLKIVKNSENADEVYDLKWAANTAAVTKLLVD